MIYETDTTAHVAGGYFTDDPSLSSAKNVKSIWIENTDYPPFKYLPINNLINLNNIEEFKLSAEQYGDSICADNDPNRNLKLNDTVRSTTKLDVTHNDLYCGDIDMVFNLTKYNLTITPDNGLMKIYTPISNVVLRRTLAPLLYIVTVCTVNSLAVLKSAMGIVSYKQLADRYKHIKTDKADLLYRIYTFLDETMEKLDGNEKARSDTIKVVLCRAYGPEAFIKKKEDSMYICEKRILVNYSNMLTGDLHPAVHYELYDKGKALESIRANGVACWIVDNHDKLGSRFINFAGVVSQVPSVKSPESADGLYVVSIDASKQLNVDHHTPIDDIDSCTYVYKNKEDALIGTDVKKSYKDVIDIKCLELAESKVNTADKVALETTLNQNLQYEKEIYRIKLQHERQLMEMRAEFEKLKKQSEEQILKIKSANERTKQESDWHRYGYDVQKPRYELDTPRYKPAYEEDRYVRDNTVDTIKAVGSISALLITAFTAYKNLK